MFAFLKPGLQLNAIQGVLNANGARWYGACLRITRDPQLAEDAVQEALLKAWAHRSNFRGEAELDTWIHRIALNAAIDLIRRQHPASDDAESIEENTASDSPSPEAAYTNRALGRDLASALDCLTVNERECFVLKHCEGWRLDEIAQQQRTNVNNTKQTLFRAVRKLRVALEEWRGEA